MACIWVGLISLVVGALGGGYLTYRYQAKAMAEYKALTNIGK